MEFLSKILVFLTIAWIIFQIEAQSLNSPENPFEKYAKRRIQFYKQTAKSKLKFSIIILPQDINLRIFISFFFAILQKQLIFWPSSI
jgi:hypothetical protein